MEPRWQLKRPIIRRDRAFNADLPASHCPRIGELVVSSGEDEGEQPASPHVTFVYPEVVGEFVYLRDDLRERLEATRARLVTAGADPDDLVDIEVLLEHTPLGEVPMVYELRTSGMACVRRYHASLAGGAMTHCATLSEVSRRAFSTLSQAEPVHFPCRVNPSFSA
jgi:hypothetical protein